MLACAKDQACCGGWQSFSLPSLDLGTADSSCWTEEADSAAPRYLFYRSQLLPPISRTTFLDRKLGMRKTVRQRLAGFLACDSDGLVNLESLV